MTDYELIDRLCAVNMLLSDIVREQAAIIKQHGIKEIEPEGKSDIDTLFGKMQRADEENDAIEAALRTKI